LREDDHYVVNGSKSWTIGAHHANRMFAIVRARDGERRQEGLTFLPIDMASPALTLSPNLDLNCVREFNPVFFHDVRVPLANRVGEVDDGWSVAKPLMQLARSNNTPSGLVLRRTADTDAAAAAGLEPDLRARLSGLETEQIVFEQLELRRLPVGRPRAGEALAPLMLTLVGSEPHQKVAEWALAIAGLSALAALGAIGIGGPEIDDGARSLAKHFSVRAASLYSGRSETQRTVIACGLGLA
jgi:acyl-CoA dehydrogenase